jgi:cytochrome P450/ferredoxin-NADP reductase
MVEARDPGGPRQSCPVDGRQAQPNTGCPVQPFDPFSGEFHRDPPASLRWAREQRPVFYSPEIGYWIVTRFDDVKAVFRDNVTFSPSIALEKITPPSVEAQRILESYDYAMARTLVNEDEPAHMPRRRALIEPFTSDAVAEHEPRVRSLTRDAVDRLVDKGCADLVDEMLWEVPLTVALHFLGVPDDDMDVLRKYSIAHTVNTWGRPAPEEQAAVAESVGRFWQHAGQVLDKIRADPSRPGWMPFGIRVQQDRPDVVTDSYLHSMMMAGIVAAHETTANAAANAIRLLLENRRVWEEICSDPGLIPNAVEECLRYSPSIVAWRRLVVRDTVVGGSAIPAGAKLLLVQASANHDGRRFDNPDVLDVWRENAGDHLSFGYGPHQCMGKNLARMELQIFLEELTTRLPHMDLVPGQEFTYLPNISFRGPEHLWVQWDPARNPERRNSEILRTAREVQIGESARRKPSRTMTVAAVAREADGIVRLTLADRLARPLPAWSAGSHIDLDCGGTVRQYSLCGDPTDGGVYEIAVLREPESRGGSRFVHEKLKVGDDVRVRGPRNHFRLAEHDGHSVLVAGGIGITAILAMADRLSADGRSYEVHYAGRSSITMAYLGRLRADHAERLTLYPAADGARLDVPGLLAGLPAGARVYACGPQRLLDALDRAVDDRPDLELYTEHFTSVEATLDPSTEHSFDLELAESGLTVPVRADQTVLDALRSANVDIDSECEEGLCGACEVGVAAGEVDHRDVVLSRAERDAHTTMMACCSRARGGRLVLRL